MSQFMLKHDLRVSVEFHISKPQEACTDPNCLKIRLICFAQCPDVVLHFVEPLLRKMVVLSGCTFPLKFVKGNELGCTKNNMYIYKVAILCLRVLLRNVLKA